MTSTLSGRRGGRSSYLVGGDRWGAPWAVGPPKQAFGRTLEEKGPRRLPTHRPSGDKATAGALTWSHAGGGRHFRNRPSLSYSAASNSSFMLGKVDEEDGHIDAALGEAVSSTQNSCVPAMNPL
jgi:hypothetical protein